MKAVVLLNALTHILHQVAGLTIKNFTKLYDCVNGHAPVVYEAVNRLGIDLVSLAEVYLFQTPLFHPLK